LSFSGEIQPEGQYNFINTRGQILLAIPEDTSCMFEVLAPKGKIVYDVPMKVLTDDNTSSIRKITAQMGEGDAVINLRSSGGTIRIKRIN